MESISVSHLKTCLFCLFWLSPLSHIGIADTYQWKHHVNSHPLHLFTCWTCTLHTKWTMWRGKTSWKYSFLINFLDFYCTYIYKNASHIQVATIQVQLALSQGHHKLQSHVNKKCHVLSYMFTTIHNESRSLVHVDAYLSFKPKFLFHVELQPHALTCE